MNGHGGFNRLVHLSAAVAGMCFGFLSPSVHALDLKKAYELASTNDAVIRAARAAADSQRERLPQARSQLMPNVSFGISRSQNNLSRTQTDFSGRNQQTDEKYISYNQTLTLRQPIFRKPLWTGVAQAGLLVDEADASLQKEEQNLAIRVTAAYLEALLAQDRLELVRVQRQTTETQLDAARKSLAAGAGTRTDVDEALARLDLVKAQELEAREHVLYTRRQLEVMVGQPVTRLAALLPERLMLEPLEPRSLDNWLAKAEDQSPELRSLRARRDAARLEIEKAQGGHYPTLDAIAQITRSGSENVTSPSSSYVNRVVGLQLNVPIYVGGYINSSVRQATAEWVRSDEALESARRELGVKVHQEYRGVMEGVARVRALEQALKSADQLVRSTRRSFEAGSRTMVDILNAEQRRQEALLDLARARYMFLISDVRIHALAGLDTSLVIQRINEWMIE